MATSCISSRYLESPLLQRFCERISSESHLSVSSRGHFRRRVSIQQRISEAVAGSFEHQAGVMVVELRDRVLALDWATHQYCLLRRSSELWHFAFSSASCSASIPSDSIQNLLHIAAPRGPALCLPLLDVQNMNTNECSCFGTHWRRPAARRRAAMSATISVNIARCEVTQPALPGLQLLARYTPYSEHASRGEF